MRKAALARLARGEASCVESDLADSWYFSSASLGHLLHIRVEEPGMEVAAIPVGAVQLLLKGVGPEQHGL